MEKKENLLAILQKIIKFSKVCKYKFNIIYKTPDNDKD